MSSFVRSGNYNHHPDRLCSRLVWAPGRPPDDTPQPSFRPQSLIVLTVDRTFLEVKGITETHSGGYDMVQYSEERQNGSERRRGTLYERPPVVGGTVQVGISLRTHRSLTSKDGRSYTRGRGQFVSLRCRGRYRTNVRIVSGTRSWWVFSVRV